MKKNYSTLLLLFILLVNYSTFAQNKKTVAELLGYPKNARLLIVHADDIGVSHSQNIASISAFEKGVINSGSIMVPCPWFGEIAAYATEHSALDLGLHLTLNSEWKYYRWDGVIPADKISSLIDKDGYFYETVEDVVKNADSTDIEKELKAQIERAIAFGIKPTHFDSHMGALFSTPELLKIYMKLGEEYKTPVLVPLDWLNDCELMKVADAYPMPVIAYLQLDPDIPVNKWQDAYDSVINGIKPGLNELVLHLAYDNDEMHAVTIDRNNWWDAPWRQRDYDYVISKRFKDALLKNNIQLVTWSQIQKVMYP